MELLGKIVMWALTLFMGLLGISYFPSFASVCAIAFIAFAVPIEPIQDFWYFHDVEGWKKGIILVALCIISIISAPTQDSGQTREDDAPVKVEKQKHEDEKTEAIEEGNPEVLEVTPVIDSELYTSEYMMIDADILFEYSGYLGGKDVVTVITVADADTNMLKAKTDNNDGYFFSVVCNFEDGAPNWVKEGDILTIAGTIEEKSELAESISFLDAPTASIENCSIIGYGEIAQELKDGAASQREIGEQAKQAYEAEVAANEKATRDGYISQCQTVNYNDVERNPDNYDGMKVKVSGQVVQVSEGWFDTVTLRVSSGGNVWYVTYSREEGESRILENDNITCYGECDGVRSYTNVLGSQVTIPSLKMEYYS